MTMITVLFWRKWQEGNRTPQHRAPSGDNVYQEESSSKANRFRHGIRIEISDCSTFVDLCLLSCWMTVLPNYSYFATRTPFSITLLSVHVLCLYLLMFFPCTCTYSSKPSLHIGDNVSTRFGVVDPCILIGYVIFMSIFLGLWMLEFLNSVSKVIFHCFENLRSGV